jgi:hypothetical protein
MSSVRRTARWAITVVALAGCGEDSDAPAGGGDAATAEDSGAQQPDAGAPGEDAGQPGVLTIVESFDVAGDAFEAVFADLPTAEGTEEFYELASGVEGLPAPIVGNGFRLSGNNHSDDLWMSVHRLIEGAVPNAEYDAAIELTLLSNVGTGCAGIGGSPGESVFVKGGVVGVEPATEVEDDYHRYTLDIGSQSQIGPDAIDLGNLANGLPCEDEPQWVSLERTGSRATPVKADASGRLWFFVGTDSGFEGITTYYVDRVEVTLTPRQ